MYRWNGFSRIGTDFFIFKLRVKFILINKLSNVWRVLNPPNGVLKIVKFILINGLSTV
ncbi:MAG: hypothetical protein RL329_1409 [Bacteroidota bacterium]